MKPNSPPSNRGRIRSRPSTVLHAAAVGLSILPDAGGRESLLYVPRRYTVEQPSPLMVMFHGANGEPGQWVELLQYLIDDKGIILLAPASFGHTWDMTPNGYGPEVERLDACMEYVFNQYAIDPCRIAIGGFSDGASYALSLGLVNEDLFTHILAFSPGTLSVSVRRGAPAIFIAHARSDKIFPSAACGQRLATQLKEQGNEVEYREFDGDHRVPLSVAYVAIEWFLKR